MVFFRLIRSLPKPPLAANHEKLENFLTYRKIRRSAFAIRISEYVAFCWRHDAVCDKLTPKYGYSLHRMVMAIGTSTHSLHSYGLISDFLTFCSCGCCCWCWFLPWWLAGWLAGVCCDYFKSNLSVTAFDILRFLFVHSNVSCCCCCCCCRRYNFFVQFGC